MKDTIRTKVVGVSYRNEDGTSRQDIISDLLTGERLHLVDMSSEDHPEAIGVFDVAEQQCGFLSKALAEDIRASGKDFGKFDVEVLEVTGGDEQHYGCNIEITHNESVCHIRCTNEGSSVVAANKAKADQEALARRAYGTPMKSSASKVDYPAHSAINGPSKNSFNSSTSHRMTTQEELAYRAYGIPLNKSTSNGIRPSHSDDYSNISDSLGKNNTAISQPSSHPTHTQAPKPRFNELIPLFIAFAALIATILFVFARFS